MPIILKDQGGNYTPAPEGTHLAICFRVVDLGVQPDSGFGEKHKLCITWELPNEKMKMQDGTMLPMSVSKTYTFSMHSKSNLGADLVRWRGKEFTPEERKGFEMRKILGKPCQLAIVHDTKDGKTKAYIDGVFAVPKGMPIPAPTNPLVEYSLEQGKDQVYLSLPPWIRGMVDAGLQKLAESQAATPQDDHVPEAPEGTDNSDVPF